MKMEKHFVTFLSPGTFVHESSTREIEKWDPSLAKEMAKDIVERYNSTPFAFYFTTRTREEDELDSKITATSSSYYLGGKVETYDQVKARATKDDEILLTNMEGNGIERIITNTNSWKIVQPLEEDDVVLQWP